MFTKFSVEKPYTIIVAIIIIGILGIISLQNMSPDLLPGMNLPFAVVSVQYPGATPEEVEMTVTRPIEQTMSSLSNVNNIRSVSRENMAMIIMEFSDNVNMDSVIVEMRENLDMLRNFLPDAAGSPMIMRINPDMMPVMVVSAALEGQDIRDSSRFLETTVIPELESVEGVASVTVNGLVEEQIEINLDLSRLESVFSGINPTGQFGQFEQFS